MNRGFHLVLVAACLSVHVLADGSAGTVDMSESNPDNKCAEGSYTLTKEVPIMLTANGKTPKGHCQITFHSKKATKCSRICFEVVDGTFFQDCLAHLELTGRSGEMEKLNCKQPEFHYKFCSSLPTLTVMLHEDANYTYDSAKPGYKLQATVTEICKKDEFKHMTKEEISAHETRTYVLGIVVGLCCACVFLIILFVTWCYYKHNPDRGPSRSVKMAPPKPFKKTMHVSKPGQSASASSPVEGGKFHYKASEPDTLQSEKHEMQPLVEGKETA